MAELVLIIDDNEQNAKLARDVLEHAGMRTLSAATAADGLALAREHLPDVVLMDLRLPDLDGGEAARRLGADERTAQIPVVALSALSSRGGGPVVPRRRLRRVHREADRRARVSRAGAPALHSRLIGRQASLSGRVLAP